MHHSTILTLALAAVNTSALLAKREDSSDALTVTATATATAAGETAIVTITSTGSTEEPTTSPNPSDSDSYEPYATNNPCFPSNSTGSPEPAAPCNLIAAIEAQCTYGPKALEFLSLPPDSASYPDFNDAKWQSQSLSPETERTCICESQILDATLGCVACHEAHGESFASPSGSAGDYKDFIQSVMQRYCNVSYVPTQSFLEFTSEAEGEGPTFGDSGEDEEGVEEDAPSSSSSSSSTQASDPIGATATAVSLYYTMSVTGSNAYDLALPTGADGNVTFTSTRTSGGQIVPTAVEAGESGSGASGSGSGRENAASTTSSEDSGAAATAYAGAAGLFAVAAFAAVGL